ncbi:MAG: type IIL restriction-modification enzyme MmeI [Planctomycetota bacterium]
MSIARHHAEWLSLVEVSGPFVSMPVLLRVFPQGLVVHDPDLHRNVRMAHEEWETAVSGNGKQGGRGRAIATTDGFDPDRRLHREWIKFVLREVLELPAEVIAEGQGIQQTLQSIVAEHDETLRPDLVVVNPPGRNDAGNARLLVQIYPASQDLEHPVQGRTWKASPDTRMMELLHATNIRLGLVTNGEQWMLVDAPRNETTGYASWYSTLWLEEPITLRAFRSLLGMERFFGVSDGDTLESILAESAQNQQDVTDQLGYQVRRAVQVLIESLDQADQDHGRQLLGKIPEADLYEAALTVMMRLVFLFCAEERGLMLLDDEIYADNYAVSTLQAQLREAADQHGEEILERRHDAWCRLLSTFRAVYGGLDHDRLKMPAYGGRLFNPDRFAFLEGRKQGTTWKDTPADPLPVNNRTVLHLLEALQFLQIKVPGGGPAEARRLSFRALDIEQIGHVYEGLLDHTAKRAAEPVLGLAGTKNKEPEIALAALEERQAKGEKELLGFLKDETGKSESALKKALTLELDAERASRFQAACGNDAKLWARVKPFAGLVRNDSFGRPVVITKGSVYVTAGTDRRSSGTHYTPTSLTDPIVRYTLEPLVYIGPADGKPKEEWKLRSPKELIDLKICDMACGCGAFLVQADRYMAERLVESWEIADKLHPDAPGITPFGEASTGSPGEMLIPKDTAERMIYARRIVAQRCLYGVDKNPLAAEMAKLSLWLLTLQKGKPFTFLDHAIRSGDSLVGIANTHQLTSFSLDGNGPDMPMFTDAIKKRLDAVRILRRQIAELADNSAEDVEKKSLMLQNADQQTQRLTYAANFLLAACWESTSAADRDERLKQALVHVENNFKDLPVEQLEAEGKQRLQKVGCPKPFHWPLEFPEVFMQQGGFDVFIGNPPFRAGRYLSGDLGENYLRYLQTPPFHINGQADVCAAFAMRGFLLLSRRGFLGMIATKTISEGDTRTAFVVPAISQGGKLCWVRKLVWWPGDAQVVVSIVVMARQESQLQVFLNEKPEIAIDATFSPVSGIMPAPKPLMCSARLVGKGVGLGSDVFRITSPEASHFREVDPIHVRRFITGTNHNSAVDAWGGEMVFYFEDVEDEQTLCSIPVAQEFLKHIGSTARISSFWRYRRGGAKTYEHLNSTRCCIIRAQTSSTWLFSFWPKDDILDQTMIAFGANCDGLWAVLTSTIHEAWVMKYGGLMKTDTTYSPSNCFNTFPLPYDPICSTNESLAITAKSCHNERTRIVNDLGIGITTLYWYIHDSENSMSVVAELRSHIRSIDNAVAAAYGWDDIDFGHGYHETKQGLRYTISEPARREVLARLLKLNHERYAEEVARGLHDKKKGGGKRVAGGGRKKAAQGPSLFQEEDQP